MPYNTGKGLGQRFGKGVYKAPTAKRLQLPLLPLKVRTSFSAQGYTFELGGLMDLRKAGNCMSECDYWRAVYVLMSRPRTLARSLYIGLPPREFFEAGPPEELVKTLERYENLARASHLPATQKLDSWPPSREKQRQARDAKTPSAPATAPSRDEDGMSASNAGTATTTAKSPPAEMSHSTVQSSEAQQKAMIPVLKWKQNSCFMGTGLLLLLRVPKLQDHYKARHNCDWETFRDNRAKLRPDYSRMKHECVSEFVQVVFAKWHEELELRTLVGGESTSQWHPSGAVCGMQHTQTLTCETCKRDGTPKDEGWEGLVQLTIPQHGGVGRALKDHYEADYVSGVKCDNCDQKRDMKRVVRISKARDHLLVGLKRTVMDAANQPRKIKTHIKLAEYETFDVGGNQIRYALRGIAMHTGEAEGGHYYAYVQYGDAANAKWWYVNEEAGGTVMTPKPADTVLGQHTGAHAYLMLYERHE